MSRILAHRNAPLLVGILALLAIASVILVRAPLPAGLASGHAAIAELSHWNGCVQCHTDKGLDAGCLACHDVIQAQLDEGKGYHAYLGETTEVDRCSECHLEHYGAKFDASGEFAWRDLDRDAFDHPHVEFGLEGAHNALECESCHSPEFAPVVHTADFPKILRVGTFLGLGQGCNDCHEDIHAGGLSPECTECHDQEVFRPASKFDHDEHYELGCAHDEVACNLCHLIPAADAMAEVLSLPFAEVRGGECLECHETPHRVAFSADCFDCHPQEACAWREGQESMTPQLHAETGFPIGRAHTDVDCDSCHPRILEYTSRFPDPTAPGYQRESDACEGCHEDEHHGQFEGRYARCRDCHTEHGFNPCEFTISDHSVWPLEGAHLAVACDHCHVVPLGREVRLYVGVATECGNCHRDPHFDQFAESAGGMDCVRCHSSMETWVAPGFDHDRDSRFPLDGDHRDVKCESCHLTNEQPDGRKIVHYRPLGRECEDCHERPVR